MEQQNIASMAQILEKMPVCINCTRGLKVLYIDMPEVPCQEFSKLYEKNEELTKKRLYCDFCGVSGQHRHA